MAAVVASIRDGSGAMVLRVIESEGLFESESESERLGFVGD